MSRQPNVTYAPHAGFFLLAMRPHRPIHVTKAMQMAKTFKSSGFASFKSNLTDPPVKTKTAKIDAQIAYLRYASGQGAPLLGNGGGIFIAGSGGGEFMLKITRRILRHKRRCCREDHGRDASVTSMMYREMPILCFMSHSRFLQKSNP